MHHNLRIVQVCSPARFTTCNLILLLDENHGDSSDEIWSMYLNMAKKQDEEVTESWKGDTEGIIVFVSLAPVHTCLSFNPLIKDWSFFGHCRELHYRKPPEPICRF